MTSLKHLLPLALLTLLSACGGGAKSPDAATPPAATPLNLVVTFAGAGGGTVSAPGMSNCTGTCTRSFTASTTPFTLTASADNNSTFSGWSGACTAAPCNVTMSQARAVTATFAPKPVADTAPPTVLSTDPASAATGVSVSRPISATFSEALACATLNSTSFTLKTATGASVAGSVTCAGSSATFAPSANLAYSTPYTLSLSTAITDLANNRLGAALTRSFTTISAPAVGDSFSFLAYGDNRAGNGQGDASDQCQGNAIHARIVERMDRIETDASFVFNLGDMQTGYDKSTTWVFNDNRPDAADPKQVWCDTNNVFKAVIAPLANKTPAAGLPYYYFPVIGNHDDNWGSDTDAASQWYPDPFGNGFCDVFDPKKLGIPNHTTASYFQDKRNTTVPQYSDARFYELACSTDRNQRGVYPNYMYYSFSFKNSHFIVLRLDNDNHNVMDCNSRPPCDTSRLSDYGYYYNKHQLDWLRYELDKADQNNQIQNVFVLLHAPLVTYSYGHKAMASWPTLLKEFSNPRANGRKVKLVMSGHNHVYERSVPVYSDPNDATSAPVEDAARGTVYVVSGGGGSDPHGFSDLNDKLPTHQAGPLNHIVGATPFHYLRIDVKGNSVSVKAITPEGMELDSFTR